MTPTKKNDTTKNAAPKSAPYFGTSAFRNRAKVGINYLYAMRLGGSLDTVASLALGSSVVSTAPSLINGIGSFPWALLPLSSAALGAAWITWRSMKPWRHEHLLDSTLNIRSDASPIIPEAGKTISGLLIGYACDTGKPVYIDDEHLMRHVYILGQSGVGKTVAASTMMFQQIQRGGGLLFIDGKIDANNIEQIYQYCCYTGRQHDFLVINPDDPENSNTYNPVLFGDPDEVADRILQLIPSTESNPGSDFYKQEAKQALNTLIAALQAARLAYNMIDLTVLLMSDNALLELEGKLLAVAPASEEAKAYSLFLDKFRQMPTPQNPDPKGIDMKKLKDVFGGIGGRLYTFGTGKFGRVMNSYDPEVNLYEAIRSNKIIYIALPTMGKDTTARNFGKMVIGDFRTVISWIQKLPVHERPWPPFMGFFDEAGGYVNDSWSRIFEQCRSAHIFLCPASQTCANFQAISDELFEMVIGNAWTKLFFKVGTQATALEAAELIGKRIGSMRTLAGSESHSSSVSFLRASPESNVGSGKTTNIGASEAEMYTVTPDDLKGLAKGECVMTYGGNQIYNLRIPMIAFDKEARERFGPFRLNRFRGSALFNVDAVNAHDHYIRFTDGANYFKDLERFLKTTNVRKEQKKANLEDQNNLKKEQQAVDTIVAQRKPRPPK